MAHKVFSDFWRAATALLLLLSIAAHGLQPVDLDFDLQPAPFSAYDDDIVRASLGPSRAASDLEAIRDALGGKGKLPAPLLEIDLFRGVQFHVARAGGSMWFVSSDAEAIRGAARSPYFARGPPLA